MIECVKTITEKNITRKVLNMIYLDYAANTPINETVLQTFCECSSKYVANPNASHPLGSLAKERMDEATAGIAKLLGVKTNEIIYTSGATEANNLAIQGALSQYKKYGKHIITSYLEHASVTNTLAAMQPLGFEIDYVDILPTGQIDLDHLKELLREDTILVSISFVDSELGVRQPIEAISEIIKGYNRCLFHVDATQAVGKIPVDFSLMDLATFAPHKFNGLNGSGVLIKKENVLLEPMIYGGKSNTSFRSGTPMLALAAATETALQIALPEIESRYAIITELNKTLREALSQYDQVVLNSTKEAVPHILNLSLKGMKSLDLQQDLGAQEIYVSTKSACSTLKTPSRPVYALTKNRKLALSTFRISLSHETTVQEIQTFLECFKICYTNRLA